MEVRPIKPEEKTAFDKIQTIAFMFKRDFSKEWEASAASPRSRKRGIRNT